MQAPPRNWRRFLYSVRKTAGLILMGINQKLASDLLEGGDGYPSRFVTKPGARQF
jgi:hypothetical protein